MTLPHVWLNCFLVLGAISVGLLYIATPLTVWSNFNNHSWEYTIAQYKNSVPILQYLPRAREIYDGHFPPADIYDSNKRVTVQNHLPSLLFSLFIFLFKGNINLAYLGAIFIFSGLIFVLFYQLGTILFNSRLYSLFFSVIAIFTPIPDVAGELPFFRLNNWAGRFVNSFIPVVRTQIYQLPFFRFDEPLLTYPIYLSAIIFFVLFWKNPTYFRAVATGVFSGLLYYTYFHHWVFWSIVLVLALTYTIIFRRKDKWLIKKYAALFGVLFLVVVPYFINYFIFVNMPGSQDFALRLGAVHGHTLGLVKENVIDYVTILFLAAMVYFFYWGRDRNKAILFYIFLGTMVIMWNVQLVTGVIPIPSFSRRPAAPFIFIILCSLFFDILGKLRHHKHSCRKIVVVGLITLVFLVVSKKLVNIYVLYCCMSREVWIENVFPSSAITSWKWIDTNLPGEPKIISPSNAIAYHLPTYTSARPFLPNGFVTMLSMKEVERRYLLTHKFFNVDKSVLEKHMRGTLDYVCGLYNCLADSGGLGLIYGAYFEAKYGSFKTALASPEARAAELKQVQENKIKELLAWYDNLNMAKERIDVDYIYIGPWERRIIPSDFQPGSAYRLVYLNPSVDIYKRKER